ncbi:MAG: HEAT repeat domain-containing protein [Planctomycetota bacterium]
MQPEISFRQTAKNSLLGILILGFLQLALPSLQPNVAAESAQKVAGLTISEAIEQLESSDGRIDRLIAVRTLRQFGEPAMSTLTTLLQDEDASIRFLACEGIGDVALANGNEKYASKLKGKTIDELIDLKTTDPSPAVRMSAAYALCQLSSVADHIGPLKEAIQANERGLVCGAGDLLGKLGPRAISMTEILKSVYQQNNPDSRNGDYHFGGAAIGALRYINPEALN